MFVVFFVRIPVLLFTALSFLLCLYVEAHVVFVCYVFMCFSFVCVSYVFLLRLFVMFVYVCAHALRSYFNDVFSCFWFFLFVFVSSVVL